MPAEVFRTACLLNTYHRLDYDSRQVHHHAPVTYGYAWVSKSDDDSGNLDTQLRLLSDHGILDELIFSDIASGHTLQRLGWQDLMSWVQQRHHRGGLPGPVQPELRG